MTGINIPTPTACATCKFKGDRWCYIMTWLGKQTPEVPEEGRPDWCPLIKMQTPESCQECQIKDGENYCQLLDEHCDWRASWAARCRPNDCPLAEMEDDK